jgi:hypothetical protein
MLNDEIKKKPKIKDRSKTGLIFETRHLDHETKLTS